MTILSKKTDQSGRSMVEMLGVLAIIGVLSVGGISGYSKAMAKYKLTKAQDQITMLLMNIRTAYATSPNYAGLSEETAADYNLAPNEMVGTIGASGSDKVLYGTFGGRVQVGTTTSENYFFIRMHALGKEACRSLATSDWGADGLVSLTIAKDVVVSGTTAPSVPNTCSGTSTRGTNGIFCTAHLPVILGDLGSSTGELCGEETNMITWVYY